MKYAIHLYKSSTPSAPREHVGYVDIHGCVMLHTQETKWEILLFKTYESAIDFIRRHPILLEEYEGTTLIVLHPEDMFEELDSLMYLRVCHKYNIHFV